MAHINSKIENKYNFISKLYDTLDSPFEHFRYKRIRQRMWTLGNGRILDAGIGTGRNIPFYPEGSEVYGIDISGGMLKKARIRADKIGKKVVLEKMDVINTNFPDNHFDTVIATFLFCVMPDILQPHALKELKRICKNNGKIIILEYEYSKKPLRRLFMELIAPYVELLYGARFDRKTLDYIKREDLKILDSYYVHQDIIRITVVQPKK